MMEKAISRTDQVVSCLNSTIGLLETIKYFKEMSLINHPK